MDQAEERISEVEDQLNEVKREAKIRGKKAQKEMNKVQKPEHFSPQKDHNSSPAREENWTDNEFDELTELGTRWWVITNSFKLKELFLTQCKDAKNHEKRVEELLT